MWRMQKNLWPRTALHGIGEIMQNPNLPPDRPSPKAGGVFIAIGTIAGVIIGGYQGQPSIGLLAGFAGGALLAALVWMFDRR